MENIKVYIRPRPLNDNDSNVETYKGYICTDGKAITMGDKFFVFDQVFNAAIKQSQIFDAIIEPIIKDVFLGYDYTILTFGQKESGKTHTMMGSYDPYTSTEWYLDIFAGIISRSIFDIFRTLNQHDMENYSIEVSCLEIYNEEITDLLAFESDWGPLKVINEFKNKEKVLFKDIKMYTVTKPNQVYDLLEKALSRKEEQEKLLKKDTSRSHIIFTIIINRKDENSAITTSSLTFVDLSRTEYIDEKESTRNKSILTLSNVLKALTKKEDYIPYIESILTKILQDSLGGKTRTTMIANVIPSMDFYNETLSTLEHAQMARNIKNITIQKLPNNVAIETEPELREGHETLLNYLEVEKKNLLEKLSQGKTTDASELSQLDTCINVLKQDLDNLQVEITIKLSTYEDICDSFDKNRLQRENDGKLLDKSKRNIFNDMYLRYLVNRSRIVNYFKGNRIYEAKYKKRKFFNKIELNNLRDIKRCLLATLEFLDNMQIVSDKKKFSQEESSLSDAIQMVVNSLSDDKKYFKDYQSEFTPVEKLNPTSHIEKLLSIFDSESYNSEESMNEYSPTTIEIKESSTELLDQISSIQSMTLPKVENLESERKIQWNKIESILNNLETEISDDCSSNEFKELCPNVAKEHSQQTSDLLDKVQDIKKKMAEVNAERYDEKHEAIFKHAQLHHEFKTKTISIVTPDEEKIKSSVEECNTLYRDMVEKELKQIKTLLEKKMDSIKEERPFDQDKLNEIVIDCEENVESLCYEYEKLCELMSIDKCSLKNYYTKVELYLRELHITIDKLIRYLYHLFINDEEIKTLFVNRNLGNRFGQLKEEHRERETEVEEERKPESREEQRQAETLI